MYVYMYVCTRFIYLCKYLCMYVHVVYIYVCIYVCMYTLYIFMYVYMYVCTRCIYLCMYLCMYVHVVYIHVCIYVCMYTLHVCECFFLFTTVNKCREYLGPRHTYVCIFICMYAWAYIHINTHAYVWMYMYVCISFSLQLYTRVRDIRSLAMCTHAYYMPTYVYGVHSNGYVYIWGIFIWHISIVCIHTHLYRRIQTIRSHMHTYILYEHIHARSIFK